MAPVNQLGVLAFAAGALAVPHAQFQPLKRHAHAHLHARAAPPAYESSAVYAASSADPWGSSSAAAVSESAPAYPSASGSWSASVEPASGSASWSAPAYPSGSSAAAVSGSGSWSAPPYPSASGSGSGWANPTGYGYPSSSYGTGYSYSAYPTGYASYSSGYPSISVCTETSTLIWKTTTSLSTYYVTHTIYESSAVGSSVSPASASGYDPAGGWGSAPAKVYSASAGADGASCVPDVTVTETVKTTVYVTPGASSVAAVASASATPACWTACFQQAGITAESDLCGNTAVDACIQDTCSSADDKAYWDWYNSYCAATSSPAASVSAVPSSAAAPSYPAAPSSASAAAPSYSAPASGGAPGCKRGLAYNDASLANAFAGSASDCWAYNWVSDGSGLDSSIPYIPMLHDASSMFTSTWQADAQKGIASGAEYLFSFNEPDMSTQANLSPEAAAAAWKQYMEPFAGQVKLVAPSVTNSQSDGMGLNWLESFLGACSGCTIDAVAQHWYFPTNDVDNFKTQITNAVSTAGGKGVWINEFGAVGSDDEKSAFLAEVMPWLDSNPDVLGYSYFMVADGLISSGSALGNAYSS